MGCHIVSYVIDDHPDLEITSIKPSLGRGRGGAHGYATYHKSMGFQGVAILSNKALTYTLRALSAAGLSLPEANVLYIRSPRDNAKDARLYHVFFKQKADVFVFKTFLHEINPEHITDCKQAYLKPHLFIW